MLTFNSIRECDVDIRRELSENIVLSGGNTIFQGLPKRFWSEMAKLVPRRDYLNIIATKDRKYSTWQGGSKLTSLSSFESKWITRDDYDEYGAEVVNRICI